MKKLVSLILVGMMSLSPVSALAETTETEIETESELDEKYIESDECTLYYFKSTAAYYGENSDPVVSIGFYFKNNSNIPMAAASVFIAEAYQDGVQLNNAQFTGKKGVDRTLDTILPGTDPYVISFTFDLHNLESDVTCIAYPISCEDYSDAITFTIPMYDLLHPVYDRKE